MTFVFQQPGTARLLKALDMAAKDADAGGGVFAFASKRGIEKLLGVPGIVRMLGNSNQFHLVVGMDAITNAEALLYLREQIEQHRGALKAHAFLHDQPGTFHPKFSWFKQGENLRLVTGSGNLTLSGLGTVSVETPPPGNWEAFTTQSMLGNAAHVTIQAIEEWLLEQERAEVLCSLDDARVQDRAMANGRVHYSRSGVGARPRDGVQVRHHAHVRVDVAPAVKKDVLVRELPQTRAGQADIGKQALKFFGYKDQPQKILIQYVSDENVIGVAYETRLFVNASKNYRLELSAIAEIGYAADDHDNRMILVASKLDRRSFRYTVVPVTAPTYRGLVELLGPLPARRGKIRPMRQKLFTSEQLRSDWRGVPSNLLPIAVPIPEP